MAFSVEAMVRGRAFGHSTMQTIFGMGLHLLWILTLALAALIDKDGTILDRGPLGSLFAVK